MNVIRNYKLSMYRNIIESANVRVLFHIRIYYVLRFKMSIIIQN